MRYTKQLEEQVLTALSRSPDAHLRFEPDDYRPDGTIIVYRDNLSEMLHRRLYKQLIAPIPPGWYLVKSCRTERCVNPHHYRLAKQSRRRRAACPNGHDYTPENTLIGGRDRCKICRDDRRARRRTTNRRPGYCTEGHKLTPSNVYTSTDVRGRVHRRCKACHLVRVRASRQRAKQLNGENND